jgi:hypothetical protein
MKRFLFGSRKRKVATAAALLFGTAGVAVAAFFLYSGISGSGQAHYANATTVGALTISNCNDPELSPGSSVAAVCDVTNNDPGAAHAVASLSGVVSSSGGATCSSHTTWDSAITGNSYAAGSTSPGVTVAAWNTDAGVPGSCASGTVSVAISGTTSP